MNKKLLSFILSFAFVLGVQPDFTKVNAARSEVVNGAIAVKFYALGEGGAKIPSRDIDLSLIMGEDNSNLGLDSGEKSEISALKSSIKQAEDKGFTSLVRKYINAINTLTRINYTKSSLISFSEDEPYKLNLKNSSIPLHSLIMRVEWFSAVDFNNLTGASPDIFTGGTLSEAIDALYSPKNFIPDFVMSVDDFEEHGLEICCDGDVLLNTFVVDETLEASYPAKINVTAKRAGSSLTLNHVLALMSSSDQNGADTLFCVGDGMKLNVKKPTAQNANSNGFDVLFNGTGSFSTLACDYRLVNSFKKLTGIGLQTEDSGSKLTLVDDSDESGYSLDVWSLKQRVDLMKELLNHKVDFRLEVGKNAELNLEGALGASIAPGNVTIKLGENSKMSCNAQNNYSFKTFLKGALALKGKDDNRISLCSKNLFRLILPQGSLRTELVEAIANGAKNEMKFAMLVGGIESCTIDKGTGANFTANIENATNEETTTLDIKFKQNGNENLFANSKVNFVTPLMATRLLDFDENGQKVVTSAIQKSSTFADAFCATVGNEEINLENQNVSNMVTKTFAKKLVENEAFKSFLTQSVSTRKLTNGTGANSTASIEPLDTTEKYCDIPEFCFDEYMLFSTSATTTEDDNKELIEYLKMMEGETLETILDVISQMNFYSESYLDAQEFMQEYADDPEAYKELQASGSGNRKGSGSETGVELPNTGDSVSVAITLSVTAMMLLALGSMYISLKKSEEI